MPELDELPRAFRAATSDVREAPVRPQRVERLVRRRRLLAISGVLVTALGLAVAIAAGLLAGKAAVDPGFDPPFFSSVSSDIKFGEPEVVRGHTRLGTYLRSLEDPIGGLSPEELRAEGLVLRGRIELVGHRGRSLVPEWSLRPAGRGDRVAVETYPSEPRIRPRAAKESRMLAVWVPLPPRSGSYVVEFKLRSAAGKVLAESSTRPFPILAGDFFEPYRTPAYRAQLPADWRLVEDYAETNGRRVSRAVGPDSLSVLIDTTPNVSGDPADSARRLHRASEGIPGYKVVKLQPARLGPTPVFEWSFQQDRRRYTDVFFFRGGDGFAVLAEGPRRRFSLIRSVAREVARSVRPVG
jgi:hypothetical protein